MDKNIEYKINSNPTRVVKDLTLSSSEVDLLLNKAMSLIEDNLKNQEHV